RLPPAHGRGGDGRRAGAQPRSLLSRRRRRQRAAVAGVRLVAGVVHRQRGWQMRNSAFLEFLSTEAKHLEQAGLLRSEPLLTTPPGPTIRIGDRGLLNFATNDYLGLSQHASVKQAAIRAIEQWAVGVASP